MRRRIIFLASASMLTALAADQLSKWIMLAADESGRLPAALLPVFSLVMRWNHGISFGMFSAQDQPLILIAISAVIVAVLIAWLWRTDSRWAAVALGLVMGGAIGNVIDRLRFGAVEDFLDVHVGPWHWPTFNLADSFIFIGVVLLCLEGMVVGRKPSKDPS